MGHSLFFHRVLLILALAITQTTSIDRASGKTALVSPESVNIQLASTANDGLTFYPTADLQLCASILPNTGEYGIDYVPYSSITNPLTYSWPELIFSTGSLKTRRQIIPALDNRTLIYPFHSFL